jgi:hypothetical protein
MCGPSNQQKQEAASEQTFAQMVQSNYGADFGAQSAIMKNMADIFTPTFDAGPNQMGFTPAEQVMLNTQSTQGVGQNYAKAAQTLNQNIAAQGGGMGSVPSGAQIAEKGQLASAAANEESQLTAQNTLADINAGRENYQVAASGLQALAQEYNPNQAASVATGASGAAYQEATQNAMQATQQFTDIAGGIAGLGKSAASGAATGFNLATAGNSSIPSIPVS